AKEGNTWLAGDSVFAHFESLKLEPDEMGTEINEGEDELDAIDKDGNEISLRKVMKSLKSKGTRTRKVGKKKVLTGETKKQDDGDDILGMVREINLDTLGSSLNADSGNISGHFPNEEDNEQVNGGKIPDSGKRKRGKVGQTTSVAAPKRRIYSSGKGANKSSRSRSTTKASRKASVDDTHNAVTRSLQYHTSDGEADSGSDDKMPDLKEKVKSKTSDLLSSCLPSRLSRGFPSKPKGNGTNIGLKKAADISGETDDVEMDNSHELAGRNNPISTPNSSMNSDRNLKRNVTGLAKCSLKDANNQSSEMIGCRIKVWWPIDKEYYKGVIQSYDAKKKKHEILYDDGEVEVLQLGRERWELISDGQHPRKRLKSSKGPSSKGMSAQKRKRTPAGSKLSSKSGKRSSSSGARQKRAPKRSVKPKKIILPESNISGSDFSDAERKENSDITPEPVTRSKFSDTNSGDSEEKQSLKSHSDTEKSDKEEDSDSEENQSPDGDKSPIDEQGSDEEKTDSEDRSVEKTQKSSTEVEETGKEVKSDSEVDSVAHESSSEAEVSDKEEKSDSEMEEVEETQKSTEAEEPSKGPTDVNKVDVEKPELQSRMEEDRENNPTDAEDSAEEVKPESQDSMEEDTEKNPTDAEKSDEEERPESQNGLGKDTEEGPTASGQSGEGEESDSSKSDCASSGDSDNVPLSVWKRKAR
ncbi:hypothetical protein MKW98_024197, partial [Papaver atlanticum]